MNEKTPRRGGSRSYGGWLLLWMALNYLDTAGAAPPTLTRLFPAGGQRGQKNIVTCTGNFAWPTKVWAPGLTVHPSNDKGKIEIVIPAQFPADRVWLRLYNDEGASTLQPFLIGNLPELFEQEPNNHPGKAQGLNTPGVTVNGVLARGDVDGFALTLQAGQTLVAAVEAHERLGAPMDAVLQVCTTTGLVLADNHDDIQLDPRLTYTARQTGIHVVRLFAFPAVPDATIGFAGGDDYIYRLTLTTGPYLLYPLPLAIASKPTAQTGGQGLEKTRGWGWNLPPNTELPITPLAPTSGALGYEGEFFGDARIAPDSRLEVVQASTYAGTARVRRLPHAALLHTTPAKSGAPFTLPLPIAVTGHLNHANQIDLYLLPLKIGQQVFIAVEARALGTSVDPLVKLLDPMGKVVVEMDDVGDNRDSFFIHRATATGNYQLQVTDRFGNGGERAFYLLTVREDQPEFSLVTSSDTLVITPGTSAKLPITVQRWATPAGTMGPITIQALGLPPSITAPTVVSEPTGPTANKVEMVFQASGEPFSGPVRLQGKATLPQPKQRTVRTSQRAGASLDILWLTALKKK